MNLSVKADFLEALDAALAEHSLGGRSQFIRDAVREKVNRVLEDDVIPLEMAAPPGRAGKGGRQPLKYPALDTKASTLNGPTTAEVKAIADKIALGNRSAARSKRKG